MSERAVNVKEIMSPDTHPWLFVFPEAPQAILEYRTTRLEDYPDLMSWLGDIGLLCSQGWRLVAEWRLDGGKGRLVQLDLVKLATARRSG